MRAPSVCLLFLIFIGKHWLKGPAMEIQSDNSGGSEPLLREIGEKEFVDHAFSGLADAVRAVAQKLQKDRLLLSEDVESYLS